MRERDGGWPGVGAGVVRDMHECEHLNWKGGCLPLTSQCHVFTKPTNQTTKGNKVHSIARPSVKSGDKAWLAGAIRPQQHRQRGCAT
eukprot:227929-Rhodomonas_salina.1